MAWSMGQIPYPSALSHQPLTRTRASLLRRSARPHGTLVLALRDRLHALVEEALQAAAVVGLGRIDVALRVGGDAVNGEELPGHLAALAEAGEDLARPAIEDPYFLVVAIGEVDELLLRVIRKGDVPRRAVAERLLRDPRLLHELAFRREHLDAIVDAVADVDEAVVRHLGAVHRRAELLRRRRLGVVATEIRVVRLVAVGAPKALELAAVGIEHDDAFVAVAVRDVGLVLLLVDEDLRDLAEVLGAVAVHRHALLADHHQELAVLRELQHHAVAAAVAADPDVALVIDGDAVVRGRPLIALAVAAAPVAQQRALLIELENRRRLRAALAGLGVAGRLERVDAVRPMDDPDVIVGVDADADRHALIPVVRQRLREGRIDLEARHLHLAAVARLRVSAFLEQPPSHTQRQPHRRERRSDCEITLHISSLDLNASRISVRACPRTF